MISFRAQKIKDELFLNLDKETILKTPVEVQRKEWNDAAKNDPLPEPTLIKPVKIENVYAEWVSYKNIDSKKSKNAVLYFHGGGNNQGSCVTHRKLVAYISKETGIPVIIHDFRKAPENPYPAALDDSELVYLWLIKNGYKPENIILGGDSSGGGLAVSLMLRLKARALGLPAAAFLLSPWLDFTLSGESIKSCAHLDPLAFEEDLCLTAARYFSMDLADNPLISPLFGDLKGLPPLFIQTGTHEVLLSDSVRMVERAKAQAVEVDFDLWDEMWHVFQAWIGDLPEAKGALRNIGQFIEKIKK